MFTRICFLALVTAPVGHAAAASKPADFADLDQLVSVARTIPTASLEPIDSEAIARSMADILIDTGSVDRQAVEACEARDARRWRSYRPDWARALARTWHCVRTLYPDPESTALADTIVRAALVRFDPNASYYAGPDDLSALARPDIGSIGVTLWRSGTDMIITAVLRDSPAALAGIGRGDRLVAIDGQTVTGLTLEEVVVRLQGPVGTSVVVGIVPRGIGTRLERQMERRRISGSAPSAELRGGILVIGIPAMGQDTAAEARDAIAGVSRDDLSAVLIDLRGSSGGLLDTVVALADLFLDGGQVLVVEERGRTRERYLARRGDVTDGLPLYLLIDGSTAAGSEALAAALSDRGRAHLIGERTMGRGEVRTLMAILRPGRGAIAVTSGRMIRPNGQPISDAVMPATPLDPELIVSDPDGTLDAATDVIRSHLGRNPTASPDPD